jgi:hypothetical protein
MPSCDSNGRYRNYLITPGATVNVSVTGCDKSYEEWGTVQAPHRA